MVACLPDPDLRAHHLAVHRVGARAAGAVGQRKGRPGASSLTVASRLGDRSKSGAETVRRGCDEHLGRGLWTQRSPDRVVHPPRHARHQREVAG